MSKGIHFDIGYWVFFGWIFCSSLRKGYSLKKHQPPAKGVSPELVEIVLKWLRTKYGSMPIGHDMFFTLEYSLREIERKYFQTDAEPEPDVDPAEPLPLTTALSRSGPRKREKGLYP